MSALHEQARAEAEKRLPKLKLSEDFDALSPALRLHVERTLTEQNAQISRLRVSFIQGAMWATAHAAEKKEDT